MIELVFDDRCTHCGKCAEVCPTDVFDWRESHAPTIARQADCHTCYLCEAHCPGDALFVGPLRTPQPVTRDEVLALGVLGNFRRALGFDTHEPGSYCYGEPVIEPVGARAIPEPRERGGANAPIYAALAVAAQRGLIDVSGERAPIDREVLLDQL